MGRRGAGVRLQASRGDTGVCCWSRPRAGNRCRCTVGAPQPPPLRGVLPHRFALQHPVNGLRPPPTVNRPGVPLQATEGDAAPPRKGGRSSLFSRLSFLVLPKGGTKTSVGNPLSINDRVRATMAAEIMKLPVLRPGRSSECVGEVSKGRMYGTGCAQGTSTKDRTEP